MEHPEGTILEPVDFCDQCWQKASVYVQRAAWRCSACYQLRLSGIFRPYSEEQGIYVVGYQFTSGYAICKPCHTQSTAGSDASYPPQFKGYGGMSPLYWKAEYTGGLTCCLCQRAIQGWW